MDDETDFNAFCERFNLNPGELDSEKKACLQAAWRDAVRRHAAAGAGLSAEDEERAFDLYELRSNRATLPAVPAPRHRAPAAGMLEASLLCLLGQDELAAKTFGPDAAEQARGRCRTALDLCELSLRSAGVEPPRSKTELVKAAFEMPMWAGTAPSTYSLPVILGNTANKMLLSAYSESPATWRAFAAVKSAADFQDQTGVRPSGMTSLTQLAPGGEIKHGTISEETYPWGVDTYARLLSIDRRDFVNDSLGAFAENSVAFGRAAMRSLNNLVYTTFLNNASFFTAPRGNLQTGAGSALQASSLATALANMLKMTDVNGDPIDMVPRVLLVPPELAQTAKALLESDAIQLLATAAGPTGNSLKNALTLVVEPRLSTTSYTGSSTTAWYVLGSPSDAVLVVGFLDGRQAPTLEFFGPDSEPTRLSYTWRCYWDYGAALGDYRAGQRSAGA